MDSQKLIKLLREIENDCKELEIKGNLTAYGRGQRDLIKIILGEIF